MRDDDGSDGDGSDGDGSDDGAAPALQGTAEPRRGARKRRGSARFVSDSDVDEDAEAYVSAGGEEEHEGREAREGGYDSGIEAAAAQLEQRGGGRHA